MKSRAIWMVIRDEEFFIDLAIQSVIDYVDGMYILDTGSKDGTFSKIFEFQRKNTKIIYEYKEFGGDRKFGVGYREVDARNYAASRCKQIFDPYWIITLDADEVFNSRYFEILSSFTGDCLAHSASLPTSLTTVSNHPLDCEKWDGIRLFTPSIRVWRSDIPVIYTLREGQHCVPRVEGFKDYLALPGRVITQDHVHFHLHRAFGPTSSKEEFEKFAKYSISMTHPLPEFVIDRWREWGFNC